MKQREKKIKNIPHKPEDEAKLEEDYLCAIKAKMELISNIDWLFLFTHMQSQISNKGTPIPPRSPQSFLSVPKNTGKNSPTPPRVIDK